MLKKLKKILPFQAKEGQLYKRVNKNYFMPVKTVSKKNFTYAKVNNVFAPINLYDFDQKKKKKLL